MKTLKTFETTLSDGKVVRVMAEDQYKAREIMQQMYGRQNVPYLPKIVAH